MRWYILKRPLGARKGEKKINHVQKKGAFIQTD